MHLLILTCMYVSCVNVSFCYFHTHASGNPHLYHVLIRHLILPHTFISHNPHIYDVLISLQSLYLFAFFWFDLTGFITYLFILKYVTCLSNLWSFYFSFFFSCLIWASSMAYLLTFTLRICFPSFLHLICATFTTYSFCSCLENRS